MQDKGSKKPKNANKLVLEIALARVLSDISADNGDKEALEIEYQEILKSIKDMK